MAQNITTGQNILRIEMLLEAFLLMFASPEGINTSNIQMIIQSIPNHFPEPGLFLCAVPGNLPFSVHILDTSSCIA